MTQSSDLIKLFNQILSIRDQIVEVEDQFELEFQMIHPNYRYNALNFVRYLKFRTFDLREIQGSLAAIGLSSLSHAERQVLANLENILYFLSGFTGRPFEGKYSFGKHPVNFINSAKRLKANTKKLFGGHVSSMGIMVTLPEQAADPDYVKDLLLSGMNIARINTAQGDPETWHKMISNVRQQATLQSIPCSIYMDLSGPKIRIHKCWAPLNQRHKNKFPMVYPGMKLFLVESLSSDASRSLIVDEKVVLSCKLKAIFRDTNVGDPIWFDDGKIGGIVSAKRGRILEVHIKRTDPKGGKLKPKKGINLPDTKLDLPALTKDDINNLDFICQHADIVGYSFVRTSRDVVKLQNQLAMRGRSDIGLVLKIENKQAFHNLPELIIQAFESPSIGIMTARGDLAVELGAERLSEVQEQIMWICEAAMIPNIWATQVLESMAKKGVISRAEITDAAMSARAECVMLNKGPFIHQALKTLTNILIRMEKHQFKKLGTLRKLQVAESFWEERNRTLAPVE